MRQAVVVAVLLAPAIARADDDAPKVTPIGYVETSFAWNFNEPSNRTTAQRGFDSRHDEFQLENVAIGGTVTWKTLSAKAILQVGDTPDTYYSPGDGELKLIQQANIGWMAPLGSGLLVQAGVFPSPIGAESFAVKDNWNWSRSNLFYGLPFYHIGAQATYDFGKGFSATIGGYNGWNHIVDENDEKSVSARVDYKRGIIITRLSYFGGVERPSGAPEGPYWRSNFDAYAELTLSARVSILMEADAGFEPNRFGTASWAAGALYARVKIVDWLYAAARADAFYEKVPPGAAPIFWNGVDWVSSGTLTLDARPLKDHVSVRLEYRHDHADGFLFYAGQVDAANTPNARSQDTVTLGATAWF